MNNAELTRYVTVEITEYIDQEIRHLEDKIRLIDSKNEHAASKAEIEMNRRLKSMNEFRDQLNKQAQSFITREEYVLSERIINQKLDMTSKIVYIGLGIVLALEIILKVAFR